MLREIGTGIKGFGTGVRIVGSVCLFLAAIVGTLAVDIVILAYLALGGSRNSGSNFLTGLLLGMLWSRSVSSGYAEPAALLTVSVVTTLIGIILASALGMPFIAMFLAVIWATAVGLTLLGLGIEAVGESLMAAGKEPAVYPSGTSVPCTNVYLQPGFGRPPDVAPVGFVPVVGTPVYDGTPPPVNPDYQPDGQTSTMTSKKAS